ncbi:MAG: hypothetical protein Kapaf2KO_09790 [Candidatus Kapaibacteriales bacterium]
MAEKDNNSGNSRVSRKVRLGLFPLDLVVFPGSYVPLYIFENRYKKLVDRCIDSDEEFAIHYNPGNKIHEYGCLVRVSEVVKTFKDGEKNIVVTGTERVRLDEVIDGEEEYLIGKLECFVPEDKNFSESLLDETVDKFNQIAEKIDNPIVPTLSFDELSRQLNPSFILAQKAGLSLSERQQILSLAVEDDRLMIINRHLKEVMPLANRADTIQKVIKNNGYIGPYSFDI